MRTLHIALPVTDSERSLAFYRALGYEVVGTVPGSPEGDLIMLKLPDDDFVTVELVARAAGIGWVGGLAAASRFVVQVESMRATLARLEDAGIRAEAPRSPDGTSDFITANLTDPDGHSIELVQWPSGHADGLTAADWADGRGRI